MILAAVLAAGNSSRFKRQKLIMMYKGKPLLQWPIDALRGLVLRRVLIVSRNLDLSTVDTADFEIVVNPDAHLGLSTSVKLAVSQAKGYEGLLLLLGDMPKIDKVLVERVLSTDRTKIVFPVHKGIKGFPVFLPSMYFEEVKTLTGDVGLRKIIAHHKDETMQFDGGEDCIFDVDTPEDFY
ncbi:MAG: nucleotidyltransferase family protein [Thermotogae bacterium]|nr:nucleotidyltransferase family protein [Thermotogota bacterium]